MSCSQSRAGNRKWTGTPWRRCRRLWWQRIIEEEAKFVDIRVIGEFEDPEWIVKSGDDAD